MEDVGLRPRWGGGKAELSGVHANILVLELDAEYRLLRYYALVLIDKYG